MFLILRRIQRDIIIKVHRASYAVPLIFVIIYSKLYLFDKFLKKLVNTNFRETPSSERRVVPYGRTDRQKDS